jgi:hypothetical protein
MAEEFVRTGLEKFVAGSAALADAAASALQDAAGMA